MTDLELKKLVYLYLMNYAMAQPDLAIMDFVNDCEDPIPRWCRSWSHWLHSPNSQCNTLTPRSA